MDQSSTSSEAIMQNIFDRLTKRLEDLIDQKIVASLRKIEFAITTLPMELLQENAELRAKIDEISSMKNSTDMANGQISEMVVDQISAVDVATDNANGSKINDYDELFQDDIPVVPLKICEFAHNSSSSSPKPSTSGLSKNPPTPKRFKVNGSQESLDIFKKNMKVPDNFKSVVELMKKSFLSSDSMYLKLNQALMVIVTNITVAADTFTSSASGLEYEIPVFERSGSSRSHNLSIFGQLFLAAGVFIEDDVEYREKELNSSIASVKHKLKFKKQQKPKMPRRRETTDCNEKSKSKHRVTS